MPEVKFCPPVIAQGAEASLGLRLAAKEARAAFKMIHGGKPDPVYKPNRPKTKYDGRHTKVSLAGATLMATTKDNPRKPGTFGYRSMAIIMRHPGLTLEDYLSYGGRMNDLRWDIEHNNVEVMK